MAWKAIDSDFPMLATAGQTVTLRAVDDEAEVENNVTYSLKYGLIGSIAGEARDASLGGWLILDGWNNG